MLRPPEHQVSSACQKEDGAPPEPGATLPGGGFPLHTGKKSRPGGKTQLPAPHAPSGSALGRAYRSAHGLAPVSLTLLRVGLRVLLARSWIQQLFQLQRQGLRPRHRHQPRLHARECAAPARARTRLSRPGSLAQRLFLRRVRHRAELRAQLRTGDFREARGGGGACCVRTGVARSKAEAPERLNRLSRSRPVCACVEGGGVSWAVRERARRCGRRQAKVAIRAAVVPLQKLCFKIFTRFA